MKQDGEIIWKSGSQERKRRKGRKPRSEVRREDRKKLRMSRMSRMGNSRRMNLEIRKRGRGGRGPRSEVRSPKGGIIWSGEAQRHAAFDQQPFKTGFTGCSGLYVQPTTNNQRATTNDQRPTINGQRFSTNQRPPPIHPPSGGNPQPLKSGAGGIVRKSLGTPQK